MRRPDLAREVFEPRGWRVIDLALWRSRDEEPPAGLDLPDRLVAAALVAEMHGNPELEWCGNCRHRGIDHLHGACMYGACTCAGFEAAA